MNFKLYRLTMVILCVAGIFFTGTAYAQSLTIAVADESIIVGSTITLGDISQISGDDSQRVNSLSKLKVGQAPLPGRSYVFTRELLGARLSAAGTDLSNVNWQVPPQFRVTALSQTVSGKEIAGKASEFLQKQLAGSDVTVSLNGQPADIIAPPGEVNIKIELPYGMKFNTPTNVKVDISIAGHSFTTANVRFDIRKYEPVAVVNRAISARELLTADKITFERRDIGHLVPGYFTSSSKLVGLAVKRQIAPGTVLTDSLLEKPVIVKRGQAVRVVAQIAGIEVSASGIAKQNGSEGQLIRVENVISKKILTAVVVDEATVRIQL